MRTSEVLHILDALERVDVRYWLAGGWGVDALHGGATREHRDLAIDADTFGMARGTLEAMRFSKETDWLPVRLEMAGGPGGWVDLHPVRFDSDGDGVQQGLDGATFAYPAADLVVGSIAGRDVPCISIRLQREFHAGYNPRPQDLHDLSIPRSPRGPKPLTSQRQGTSSSAAIRSVVPMTGRPLSGHMPVIDHADGRELPDWTRWLRRPSSISR